MHSLKIRGLHKRFRDKRVLNGLDLAVQAGSIFGFVGPNGAGKTTTMRLILGLLKPDSGEIAVCGEPVRYGDTPTNRLIGYLPDMPAYYDVMRPMEYLMLSGAVAGLPAAQARQRAGELLERVGLAGERHRIGGFSRGMKQRLGIAQALLRQPALLICDEPTSALDPAGRHDILMLLKELRGQSTVLFSTHILTDVERICDHLALLNQGRIVLSGAMQDIRGRLAHSGYEIQFRNAKEAARFTALEGLSAAGLHASAEEGLVTVQAAGSEDPGRLLIRLLSEAGMSPQRFAVREKSLDDLYLEAIT